MSTATGTPERTHTPSQDGAVARRRDERARPRRALVLAISVVAVVALAAAVALSLGVGPWPGAAPVPAAPPTAAPRLTAHGEVRPIHQAHVATLSAGVVRNVAVRAGDRVATNQELAQVASPTGLEVLVAPWSGTVTSVEVEAGDSVMPGSAVATVADLRQLEIETTDVDEFLVGHVAAGQRVHITIDALERDDLSGRVRTVALEAKTTATGDLEYPVTIDLAQAPGLRPGMTARLDFAP